MEDLEICKGQRGIYGGNSVLWVLWNNRKMSGSIVRMAQTGESNPKKEQRKKKISFLSHFWVSSFLFSPA